MDEFDMQYDVVIIGAGPSGLSAAIRLKQLARDAKQNISVCILEKGAQVGAHLLSGAVLNPCVLKNLLPETWHKAPLNIQVAKDGFYYLTKKSAYRLPTPAPMKNDGNYIISLGELCQFLAKEAEDLGCEIYPGFAATKVLYHENGGVMGVQTGAVGIDKNGDRTTNYQPGMRLNAKQTLFAEGCRGQLSQLLMHRFQLRKNVDVQTYGLGFKEIWSVTKEQHDPGSVIHTVGWPLQKTYGGSFLYHLKDRRVAIGFVVGLDYQNPWMDPFEEFQRFKTHPWISRVLQQGERLSYGARALNEGGWQSIPKLTFPGGVLIGDSAGFLNVPQIKGIHTAMHSGIIAAETTFTCLSADSTTYGFENLAYEAKMQQSWVVEELYKVRNIRPGFHHGLWIGLSLAAFETYISYGKSPWTLKHRNDYASLKLISHVKKINYPKPDGVLTFDRLSSVYLSNTYHEENQPCHLMIRDYSSPLRTHDTQYASPETRYCPAGVYELVHTEQGVRLNINAQNCIHCKTCDIKDPRQLIQWTAPEGGGGPNYVRM